MDGVTDELLKQCDPHSFQFDRRCDSSAAREIQAVYDREDAASQKLVDLRAAYRDDCCHRLGDWNQPRSLKADS
jgi:hypothetical protein